MKTKIHPLLSMVLVFSTLAGPQLAYAEGSFLDQIRTRTDRNLGSTGEWFALKSNDWVFYGDEASASNNMGALPDGMKVEVLKWNNHMARVRLPDGRVVFVRNRMLTTTTAPSAQEKAQLAALTAAIGKTSLSNRDPSQPPTAAELSGFESRSVPAAPVAASTIPLVPPLPIPRQTTTNDTNTVTTTINGTVTDGMNVVATPGFDNGNTPLQSIPLDNVIGSTSTPFASPSPPSSSTPSRNGIAQTTLPDLSSGGIPITGANLGSPRAPIAPATATVGVVNGQPLNVVITRRGDDTPAGNVGALPTLSSINSSNTTPTTFSNGAPIPAPRPRPGLQTSTPTGAAMVRLANGRMCDPTKNWQPPLREAFRLTDCMGAERSKGARHHAGVDLAGATAGMQGNDVYPAAKGRVIQSGFNSGYGCYIKISHRNCPTGGGEALQNESCTTAYAHLQVKNGKCDVPEVGTEVTPCTRIAGMSGTGSRGRANDYASHVHFEVHAQQGALVINPTVAVQSLISSPDRASEMVCNSKRGILAVTKYNVNRGGNLATEIFTNGRQ